jgi:hypothetical protein
MDKTPWLMTNPLLLSSIKQIAIQEFVYVFVVAITAYCEEKRFAEGQNGFPKPSLVALSTP